MTRWMQSVYIENEASCGMNMHLAYKTNLQLIPHFVNYFVIGGFSACHAHALPSSVLNTSVACDHFPAATHIHFGRMQGHSKGVGSKVMSWTNQTSTVACSAESMNTGLCHLTRRVSIDRLSQLG